MPGILPPTPAGPGPAIPGRRGDEPPRVTLKLRFALFGVLAALAGTGVGHLVGALTRPESSPVLAVGQVVSHHPPTPVTSGAIAHFGTHDKTILVGSVLVGVLVLAAVAGLLARRSFRYGAALLTALVAVALYAALSRPVVHLGDAAPGIVTGLVGVAVLRTLTRPEQAHPRTPPSEAPAGATTSPRVVLAAAGGVAAVAAASGYAGRV